VHEADLPQLEGTESQRQNSSLLVNALVQFSGILAPGGTSSALLRERLIKATVFSSAKLVPKYENQWKSQGKSLAGRRGMQEAAGAGGLEW